MKICMIAEGCYPYVVGGVSSWIHNLIRSFPGQEFVILAIVADRSWRGKFVYDLPDNVTEVHELYLEDSDWKKKEKMAQDPHEQKGIPCVAEPPIESAGGVGKPI